MSRIEYTSTDHRRRPASPGQQTPRPVRHEAGWKPSDLDRRLRALAVRFGLPINPPKEAHR